MFIPFLLLGALVLVGYRYRRLLLRHSSANLPQPASSFVRPSRLQLTWESEALNPSHDVLVALFANKGPAYRLSSAFYNVGAVLGVAGVGASLVVLAWQCVSLSNAMWTRRPAEPSSLSRRVLNEALDTPESGEALLKPLIPGVTMPLSELPLLIVALLGSQAFHELGHIVSSALPPAAASLSGVGIALQGAFVSLLPHLDEARHPWARVRNAAAGAWHNVVMWIALWATCQIGLHTAVRDLFWRDVLFEGLAVVSVDRTSALRGHVEPGAVIVALDDTWLHSLAAWEDYLLARPPYAPVELGWCVDSAMFLSHPNNCDLHPGTTLFTPFPLPSFADPFQNHCQDPLSVFQTSPAARCISSASCTSPSHLCIAPVESTQLLRVQVKEADHGHAIVWKGPRREVFEQVRVGQYIPRVPIMPMWALPTLEAFFEYLRSLTLALALLNLLPLRPLDGGVVLSGMLEILSGRARDDIELLDIELGRRMDARRPRRIISVNPAPIVRWVHNVVAVLGLFVTVCSLWIWTIRGP